MEWYEISKIRPPNGELIWVWDKTTNSKFLIRYMGSEESWLNLKDNDNFPIWAYLNNQPERSKREDVDKCIKCGKTFWDAPEGYVCIRCGTLNSMET